MFASILRPTRFTGWHMAGVLALFFGVTIFVNVILAIFASGSWTGLVVKNSYVASQHYNERIANDEWQASLGWVDSFTYDDATVSLTVTDAAGRPLAIDSVTAVLRRPAAEQQDHTIQLVRSAPERFDLRHPLATGLWAADIRIKQAGQPGWIKRYRFTVTAEETDLEALAQ